MGLEAQLCLKDTGSTTGNAEMGWPGIKLRALGMLVMCSANFYTFQYHSFLLTNLFIETKNLTSLKGIISIASCKLQGHRIT